MYITTYRELIHLRINLKKQGIKNIELDQFINEMYIKAFNQIELEIEKDHNNIYEKSSL